MITQVEIEKLINWVKNSWDKDECDEFLNFIEHKNIQDEDRIKFLVTKNANKSKSRDENDLKVLNNIVSNNTILVNNLYKKLGNLDNYVLDSEQQKVSETNNIKISKIIDRINELKLRIQELNKAKKEFVDRLKNYQVEMSSLNLEKEDLFRKIMSSTDSNIGEYNERINEIVIDQDEIKSEIRSEQKMIDDFNNSILEIEFQIQEQQNLLKNLNIENFDNYSKFREEYDESQRNRDEKYIELLLSKIEVAKNCIRNNSNLDYEDLASRYFKYLREENNEVITDRKNFDEKNELLNLRLLLSNLTRKKEEELKTVNLSKINADKNSIFYKTIKDDEQGIIKK